LRVDAGERKPRPDLAFTRRRVAVFVDGCFWHGCPVHGVSPKSNTDYWAPKLARNAQRDRLDDSALDAAGWRIVRLWEHEPLDIAVATVEAELPAPRASRGGRARTA
jgi:DNA mismatch endonuclease (patch repair protein)